MLLLSAIATSIDSFLIGITFKKINLNKFKNLCLFFYLTSFIIFIIFHLFLSFIPLNFNNSFLKFSCFFFFGCLNLKNDNEPMMIKNKIAFIILIALNSLDGFLVSLLYRNLYNIFFLSFLFSTTSLLFLILGNFFSPKKKNQWLSPFLYFTLAFLSII